jgi:hypothetical protein
MALKLANPAQQVKNFRCNSSNLARYSNASSILISTKTLRMYYNWRLVAYLDRVIRASSEEQWL